MIWGVNGFVILSLLTLAALYTFYNTSLRASAADPVSTATVQSVEARKLPPTSYFLPTLTPNPFYTPPVFETVTPFVLVNGPHPALIGFSFGGRPIDAYRFGVGENEYLVVAGIHGGYEGNTI